ncbi:MAG: phosphoesterase [Planctomycetales bacterium]
MSPTERVLVVPTEVFHAQGRFQGFCPEAQRYVAELLKPEHVSFRPRSEVEEDPSFKQLIPYVLFRHEDSLFQYTRGSGQGEKRLHRKRSVGIGGHISAEDAEGSDDPYRVGMQRELTEEVHLDAPYAETRVGLINDDETPVGQVHLGVVHVFRVERPEVRAREDDVAEASFQPIADILSDLEGFETWSQIVAQALFGDAAKPDAS